MRTRKLWVLLLAVVCLLALSVTAFAKVDGDSGVIETWAQIAEPPPDTAPATPAAPAKPDTSENHEPDSGTAAPPVCSCGEKCAVGAVNTACPVC